MDESNYPSNSNRDREEAKKREKIEKVVSVAPFRRRKTLTQRMTEALIPGDPKGVVDYLVKDILLPSLRELAAEIFREGIERVIRGEPRSASRRSYRSASTNYNAYNKYSGTASERYRSPEIDRQPRITREFDDIVFKTRAECEVVLDALYDLIRRHRQASVSDLFQLIDLRPEWTDERRGWYSLTGADIRVVRDGYVLRLPPPESLR